MWSSDTTQLAIIMLHRVKLERVFSGFKLTLKSPNINIHILLSDLNTFSYSISWENLLKDQDKFPLVITVLILITFSLNKVLILRGGCVVSRLKYIIL